MLDADGQFVMPGIMDGHVHLLASANLARIAYVIKTGVVLTAR